MDHPSLDHAVDLWTEGRREEAIATALAMVEVQLPPGSWTLHAADSGSPDLKRIMNLRQLVLEVDSRAGNAIAGGQPTQARRLVEFIALAALATGEPGTSENLVRLGAGFQKLVSQRRAELARVGQVAAAKPVERTAVLNVIELWAANQREDAIRQALEMLDRNEPVEQWRVCNMSEAEYLTAYYPAHLEEARERLSRQIENLRACVREMDRRLDEQIASNDFENARRTIEFIRRLGEANREPYVPALVELVGRLYVNHSAKRNQELEQKRKDRRP